MRKNSEENEKKKELKTQSKVLRRRAIDGNKDDENNDTSSTHGSMNKLVHMENMVVGDNQSYNMQDEDDNEVVKKVVHSTSGGFRVAEWIFGGGIIWNKGKNDAEKKGTNLHLGKGLDENSRLKSFVNVLTCENLRRKLIFRELEDYSQTENGVKCTWMAFGGNTRDLGSFREETDETTTLHQSRRRNGHTNTGDGVTILVTRSVYQSDDVRNLMMASGSNRLEETLKDSTG
ncbi:hypothetical protein Tco_0945824 [Tanacetum coccineum]